MHVLCTYATRSLYSTIVACRRNQIEHVSHSKPSHHGVSSCTCIDGHDDHAHVLDLLLLHGVLLCLHKYPCACIHTCFHIRMEMELTKRNL